MTHIAGFLAIVILLLLSGLHVYWAFGGRWGFEAAIPVVEGRPLFRPGPIAALVVAALLALAAVLVAGRLLWHSSSWAWAFFWGSCGVSTVFFVRAVGDFRLLGFFKRVRGTRFAELDSRVFSPLCLAIALLTLAVLLGTA